METAAQSSAALPDDATAGTNAAAATRRSARERGEPQAAPALGSVRWFGRAAATSRVMHEVFDVMERLAGSDVTVTLLGDTGTGKEVFARALHEEGPRAQGPFMVYDCGSVPPNLMESELFGHERGAFTGAHAEHPGAFERARKGTLFLDEIGELPLALQTRLLRVLDGRSVRRVGGTTERHIDVRVVAATNRDLKSLVAANQFREDVYFRLAGAVVELPRLRDRLDDLPVLVGQFLARLGRSDIRVLPETYDVLRAHAWPGNIRELKNLLACALVFVDADVDDAALEPRHLRFIMPAQERSTLEQLPLGGQTLEKIERVAIKQTLAQTRGNKVQAAKVLGIASSTLYEKLKKYRLRSPL